MRRMKIKIIRKRILRKIKQKNWIEYKMKKYIKLLKLSTQPQDHINVIKNLHAKEEQKSSMSMEQINNFFKNGIDLILWMLKG